MQLKLSVILPCFNGAATIAVQLEALTCQQWPGGWEVIVVNNGSTDASMDIVASYRDRLPDLKTVEAHVPGTPRLGVPHSYNTGIKAASGDAFVFCEADDEVAPGWLSAMGRALSDHPFVLARLEHRKLNAARIHPPYGDGYQFHGLFRNTEFPYFQSASFAGCGLQRTFYEQLGPLSTEFPIGHDSEYCWRAQAAGFALHFEPEAVCHYREKADAGDRFRQARNWGRDAARIQQHYGVPLGRFALLRQLLWIARSLPAGPCFALYSVVAPRGRQWLADWVWNLGWSWGRLQAILGQADVPVRKGPAIVPASGRGDHA